MGLALFKERRSGQRKRLTGLMPGPLKKVDSGELISARPVDVSQAGMGIISSSELEVGALLEIKLDEQIVKLEVRWSRPDFAKSDLVRYGLHVVDLRQDLEKIFIDSGCLV